MSIPAPLPGLPLEDALALADDVSRPASLSPVLVLSHLACGDDPASPMNHLQLESFRRVSAAFEGVDSSLSASAGTFLGAAYHFDLTRPGIALYGGEADQRCPEPDAAGGNPPRPASCRSAKRRPARRSAMAGPSSFPATAGWPWSPPAMPTAISVHCRAAASLRDTGIAGACGCRRPQGACRLRAASRWT